MPIGYFSVLTRRRWSVASNLFTILTLAGFVVFGRADESRSRLPQHAGTPPHSTSRGLPSSSTVKDQAKIGAGAPGSAVCVDPGAKRVSPPPPGALANAQLIEGYGKLPLSFEPNRGQTDPKVKFLSRGPGYGLFLTSSEAVLTLRRGQSKEEKIKDQLNDPRLRDADAKAQNESVLRLKLVGANPASKVNGLDELPGKSNYFIGNDPKAWRTDVLNFARVQYQDVYPGVDLVYYGNQRQLEYDWVVKPGADLKTIRMAVVGAGLVSDQAGPLLRIDASGDLVIQTEGGEVRFQKPVVYQLEEIRPLSVVSSQLKETRHALDGHYVLRGRRGVGFEVASYDHGNPLIIDPVLSYSTYLGGSASDQANGIAVDATGNAYLTGDTASTDFPYLLGLPAPNNAFQGVRDVFVTKLNATGTALIYSTYLGGSANDLGSAIAIDAAGNAYVTGSTFSGNFPVTSGAFQTLGDAGACSVGPCQGDAFATKLNNLGNALLYSTRLGGAFQDNGSGIAIDAAPIPNIYVTGTTRSPLFPTTTNGFQLTCPSCPTSSAVFVSKIAPLGGGPTDLKYSSFLGGGANDQGNAIIVDGASNAYVTGFSASATFPTTVGAFQTINRGLGDAFVAKFNPGAATGLASLVYSTLLGGGGNDEGKAIAVDLAGNAYVTGLTQSASTPWPFPLKNPLQQFLNGTQNAFVTKLDPTGALIFSTYFGGSQSDVGNGITIDSGANVFFTGFTSSINFPVTSNAYQPTADGGACTLGPCNGDGFVTKLNAAGSAIIFSTYLGGSAFDIGNGIAIDSPGNAYVTGSTQSSNFPSTTGVFQPAIKGTCLILPCLADAFVSKLSGLKLPVARLTPPSLAFGSVTVGASSAPLNATLSNVGDATLNISFIVLSTRIEFFSPTPDYSQTSTCGPTLAPGASCVVSITFSPRTGGLKPAFLKITDDSASGFQGVSLSGTGVVVGPLVALSPTSLDFGKQLVGTSSVAQTVTLQNTGVSNLIISSIVPSADYTSASTCPISPSFILPSGTCTITVTFAPTVTGPNFGSIMITDNAPFSPQQIILTGTGFAPVPQINQPPVPTATSAGGLPFTLTVNGTGFVSGATVKWDGSARATTFINSTRLTAAILAADIATLRTASVTVVNPGPAFSTSNVIFFPVTSPTPTVTFAPAPGSPITVGTNPVSVAVGDFNGDGKMDIAVTNYLGNNVTILLGNGNGTFTAAALSPATGAGPNSLGVGDFNGDGKLDLAVTNANGNTMTILLGDGTGNFTPTAQAPATGTQPFSVAVGDFNGDGKLDLAVANHTSNNVTILLGNGDGTFTPTALSPTTGTQPISVAVGDFNGDGKLDLAVANNISNNLTILLGDGTGNFTPALQSPTTGLQPQSVVVGDFNGDGKLDVAVANVGSNNVSILLGNGNGTFTATALSPATGVSPYAQVIGDFNGDGKLDLAVANYSRTVTILLGDGAGNFTANPQTPATGINPYFVATGDFNGDGRLDLAIPNAGFIGNNKVTILLQAPLVTISPSSLTFGNQLVGTTSPAQTVTLTNTGSATLNISTVTFTGANPGDFTKTTDTCTAVVLAPGSSCILGTTFVPTAPGARTAALTIPNNAGGSPHTVPLSGVGVQPIASLSPNTLSFGNQLVGTTSAAQTVTLTNTGTATLTITSIVPSGDFALISNTCGPSLAVSAQCTFGVRFTPTNTGSRTGAVTLTDNASPPTQTITLSGFGTANAVPQINQPLVPTAKAPGSAAFTLTANGTGFVPASVVKWNGSARTTSFVSNKRLTATINAADIATASTASVTAVNPLPGGGSSNIEFLQVTNPTPSVFLSRSDFATGTVPILVAAGDFNGDGKLDLVVANLLDNTVSVLLANGDGTFQTQKIFATGAGPFSVSTGDFNGDGKLDVAVANTSDNTVSILLGNGDGTFQSKVDYATGLGARSAAVGDFNGDGKLDLAVANLSSNTVSILLGNGDGTFQTHVDYPTGSGPVSVITGDFNGDGKLDLAVANNNVSTVSILLGNGDGTFQTHVDFGVGSAPISLTAADFNGDGKLDLAVGNQSSNTISILLGNGNGTFQPHTDFSTGSNPISLTAGDFNGDGKLDLAVANNGATTVSILPGNGDGTFQARVDFNTTSFPLSLTAGDFNGDGRLDLAVTNGAPTNSVSILLQAPAVAASPTSLSFGNQLVGTASLAQTVTLTNSGSATLNISTVIITGVNPGDFTKTSDTCTAAALAPGSSCTLGTTFMPAATGARTASYTITDNAPGSPQTVNLTGTGIAPVAGLAPASLSFANQLVGTPSAPSTATLSSTGTATLTIASIVASGDFAQSNNCGASLAVAASCTITVTFTPTVVGARTGAITVTDNHNAVNGSTQTVTLTGTGIAPVAGVAPASLSFVNQPLGTTSAAQIVTLTNSGTGVLTITSVVPSGDFAVSNNCAGSVPPGSSCALSVTFTPTAAGTRSGSITITDSAVGSPRAITLSGTATGGQVALSPTGLQLPDTHVNQTCLPRTVTLTNSGAAPLSIAGVAINGQFTQTNSCPVGPATLAPGASCLITVTFVPTTTGAQTGTLTVTSDAPSSPNTVALAGNGKVACLVVPAVQALTVIRGADTATFSLKHQTDGGAAEDPLRMYCTSQAPATCAFDPGLVGPMGTSTLTLSNLKAVHAGLLMFDVHGDAALDKHTTGLTVLISDFAFSSAPDAATVAAGQSTSFALVAAPQNGLQGTLNLSCSGAPAGATCAVAPSAVTLTGAAPVSVTVTVSTTARSLAPPGDSRRVLPLGGNPIGLFVLVMLGLMSVLGLMASVAAAKFSAQKSRSLGSVSSLRLRLAGLGAGLTMAMVLAWGACGGGSFSGPPASTLNATPAGTYNLTVTGTYTGAPGTNAQLSHAAVLKLTVN